MKPIPYIIADINKEAIAVSIKLCIIIIRTAFCELSRRNHRSCFRNFLNNLAYLGVFTGAAKLAVGKIIAVCVYYLLLILFWGLLAGTIGHLIVMDCVITGAAALIVTVLPEVRSKVIVPPETASIA